MPFGDTQHPSTPKGRWSEGSAKESELLGKAIEDTGVSKAQIAERWGMHPTRVGAMCNPEMSNASVPARVLWLGGKVGDALWEAIGALRAQMPRDMCGDNHVLRCSLATKACSALLSAYMDAIADGKLDEAEKALLRPLVAEVRKVCSMVEASLG